MSWQIIETTPRIGYLAAVATVVSSAYDSEHGLTRHAGGRRLVRQPQRSRFYASLLHQIVGVGTPQQCFFTVLAQLCQMTSNFLKTLRVYNLLVNFNLKEVTAALNNWVIQNNKVKLKLLYCHYATARAIDDFQLSFSKFYGSQLVIILQTRFIFSVMGKKPWYGYNCPTYKQVLSMTKVISIN